MEAFPGTSMCKDYADRGHREAMELDTSEFVRRFSLPVLPKGFQKIRRFGLFSNHNRKEKIAAARALLREFGFTA